MVNALDREGVGYVISASAAPTEDQRAFMLRRADDIADALEPAPEALVLVELTALLRVMAIKGGDESELEAVIRIYLDDMVGLPMFAVVNACRAFRRGDVGNGRFAPTPGELRVQAKTYIAPWVDERAKLLRVLDAKVLAAPTPESEARREAALAHIRATLRQLRETTARQTTQVEAQRPPTVKEAQDWLDRYEASAPTLPKLSSVVRKALGLQEPDDGSRDA